MTNTYYPGTGLLNSVTGTPSGGSAVEYAKCTKYAPTGKIGKITHAYNNTKTDYTYDAKTTRLATLKTSGPAPGNVTIQNKSYIYSKAGDIKTITDLMPGGVIYTYEYDNLHRLLEETTSDNTLPTDADIMTYDYGDSEHINAVTSITYNGTDYGFTYDANGNMKDGWDLTDPNNIVERDITWNADNMPVTVTRGSNATDLTYDGDGVRAKKVEVGTTTYYVSNDYEIKNSIPIKYIFAGNLRVAEVEDTVSTIFHKDHLGSSTAMTNNAGVKVETTEYFPFGSQRSHTGEDISAYKFTDQAIDISSNLYNYDARLYDPLIGRFISADVLIQNLYDPQTLNRFSYCRNDPLKYIDPSGHEFMSEVIKGDFDNSGTTWGGVAGQIGVGLIPVVGQITDIRDTAANGRNVWNNPTKGAAWAGLGGAIVAWVPGIGDALKGVFKGGKKVLGSADEISSVANKVVDDIPDGSFSIFDWSGYPDGIPKPEGTFRLLEGAEYDAARKAANNSNSALHKADPSLKGKQVHEIKPVKFDGSPTDQVNKIPLTREEHTPVTNWWNDLMRWFKK